MRLALHRVFFCLFEIGFDCSGRQTPPGGDFNGAADRIQRHLVLRRQRLNAGNPGNHLKFEGARARGQNRLKDAHGAVVQRRVAPHQETAALTIRQLVIDQALEGLLLGTVQLIDTGGIVDITALAFRAVGFDEAIVGVVDVALTDLPTQVDQLVLALAFIHQKEHVDPVQRLHGLHRHVVGVTGADADHQQLFHHKAPLRHRRQRPVKRNSTIDSGSTSMS